MGGCLIVIVNPDPYLERKKGYVFMPLAERMEILAALRCVDFVVPVEDSTDVVSAAVRALRPDIFAKGLSLPDPTRLPEWVACREVGCRVVLDVGGAKTRSSSGMVERVARAGRGPQVSEPNAP
jgi:bifunctional ADP-heptose synthase (sugar kinase/adenylyltransferase)